MARQGEGGVHPAERAVPPARAVRGPVLGTIGTVDRVDERLGEHCVVVVFDLWAYGTRWTDRFKPGELVPA